MPGRGGRPLQGDVDKDERKDRFLDVLEQTNSVTHACKAITINRRTAYLWREQDPEWAADWDDIKESNMDELEASAYERAMRGETVLTIFLMKGWKPDKYRDNWRGEITGPGGGALRVRFLEPEPENGGE